MVTVNNYYNNIPVGRDLNNLPNTSSAGTTVGYQYDGLTEEDRFVQKVLREHYDKMYKENMSHSDPMAYIESKYCDVTSMRKECYKQGENIRLDLPGMIMH